MNEFLHFIESLSTFQKALWLATCMSLGWLLEYLLPFFHYQYNRIKHNLVNLAFLLMTMIINLAFSLLIVKVLYPWMENHSFSLLNLIEWPLWAELVIALLFFDFMAQYLAHVLLHKIPFMWRFHMIHHSDTKVVATTGTRHHPGDYIIREVFSLLAILITGAPFSFYMIYRMITIPFTYLTHVNVLLPIWLDKIIGLVFISPNIHKFHHHYQLPWTDSNYGNILSIWDRLFGTLVYADPRKIRYGLDVLDDTQDENIAYQLRIPFWRKIPKIRAMQ